MLPIFICFKSKKVENLVIIALVVVFVFKNKPNSNWKETSRKQLSQIDPRFGAIDSKTEITLNVSEISNAPNASNTSSISQ
jgi:hypothetical protein